MNHAQPFRVSVVEIPLLLDSIVQNLSHNDIWNCAKVCTLWREIFEPHQWRHVSLINKDGTPFLQSLPEVERARIVQHAGRIRTLTVNFGDKLLDQFKCPKLETLIFALGWVEWKLSDWSSFSFELNDDDNDSDDVDMDDSSDDEDETSIAVGEADVDMVVPAEVDGAMIELAAVEDMLTPNIELGNNLHWWNDEDDEDDEDEGGEGINNNFVMANLEGDTGPANVALIPDQGQTISRNFGGVWSLLDRTPGLLTLHLTLGRFTPDLRSRLLHYFSTISSSIRTNEVRHLMHLTLEFYNTAGVDEVLLLRHLPESLLSLRFRIYASHRSSSNQTRAIRNNDLFVEAALSLGNNKELYPLRALSLTRVSLQVDTLEDFGGREVLRWLLRQCSQLKDLSLPSLPSKADCELVFQTLVRYCSKIERLCLNMEKEMWCHHQTPQVYASTAFESQVFSMLAPLALKKLSIDIGSDGENITLQTLEQWSKDSLEELQLVRTGPMEASEFEKIRSTYPRLNQITYWKGPRNSAPEVNVD